VPEDAGVLAPAGDAEGLADAILKVYADEASFTSYQQGARNAPAGKHDAKAMLESYLEIYAAALNH
jgi:glycosyltransferase involved in cell wall biosynthesis